MDAGVAPADVRPGWLSHRDVSHSWLAGTLARCLYHAAQRCGCSEVFTLRNSLLYLTARVLTPSELDDELLLRFFCALS